MTTCEKIIGICPRRVNPLREHNMFYIRVPNMNMIFDRFSTGIIFQFLNRVSVLENESILCKTSYEAEIIAFMPV